MGLFNIHTGSWGTPEFGITESIAGLLGNTNRSDQLGSNLRGSNSAVLGASNNNSGLTGAPAGISFGTPTTNSLFGPAVPKNNTSGGGNINGSVLGTSTTNSPSLPSNDQSGQINQGWDSYTNQLNDLLNNNLPSQRASQEQIAQNAYNTGINQAGQQKEQGIADVNNQQASSLKDLSGNIRNLFNAGNTYLGSRGASDSSAANQYSYAITQMGTKERGNIMKQAQDRISQIGDIYNAETNRLQSDLTNNMAAISQWFSEQQAQLKQQLGQAGLGRSQDLQAASQNLYNQALGEMQRIQADISNRRSSLESWALSNSKTVQEALANMNAVSNSMPQFQGIQGGMPQVTPEGQQYLPTGYGATEDKNKGLFQPII